MAYGIINTTLLLSLGIPPVVASASIHVAEVFTTGISGLSHAFFKNIHRQLLIYLAVPGVVGAVTGAFVLAHLSERFAKTCIVIYLTLMGLFILYKAIRMKSTAKAAVTFKKSRIIPLGLLGGFFDVAAGGGWGPIVTPSLIASGIEPRYAVGSTNFAEFFVALFSTIVFILILGISVTSWQIFVGLLVGGAIAAPLSAYVARSIPRKIFTFIIAIAVILLSLRMMVKLIFF